MRETAEQVITEIEIRLFTIPLRGSVQISTMNMERAENLLVKLVSSDGVCGWGEASPMRSITGETQAIDLAAAAELRTLLLGRNPLAIGALSALIGPASPSQYDHPKRVRYGAL